MNDEIKLGDRAKDIVTGFEGIVVARIHWLMGCDRIVLQPEKLKDGNIVETKTFDIMQVKLVKAGVIKSPELAESKTVKTGGPIPTPVRRQEVR